MWKVYWGKGREGEEDRKRDTERDRETVASLLREMAEKERKWEEFALRDL